MSDDYKLWNEIRVMFLNHKYMTCFFKKNIFWAHLECGLKKKCKRSFINTYSYLAVTFVLPVYTQFYLVSLLFLFVDLGSPFYKARKYLAAIPAENCYIFRQTHFMIIVNMRSQKIMVTQNRLRTNKASMVPRNQHMFWMKLNFVLMKNFWMNCELVPACKFFWVITIWAGIHAEIS